MNILLLTPQLPYPPHQGTTIRNFYLLRYLAQHHQVDLLTFLAPGEQLQPDNPLYKLCRRICALPQPHRSSGQRLYTTLRSSLPDMGLRLESAEMHRQVAEWRNDTDYAVIQIEGIEMAQYGLRVARRPYERIIFDDHNCEYLLQKRNAMTDLRQPRRWPAALYSLIQWQKLRRYERQICQAADAVLAVSPQDQAALLALDPQLAVTVLANGIDLASYPEQPVAPQSRQPIVLFTGKMDYRPNVDAMLWFGEQVLPLIQKQRPDVQLQIVGSNPHPRLASLRHNPAIIITGSVPETAPYFGEATVCAIPMRVGGGTRLKALEAMAHAKPIVSTRLGIEGIPVTDGEELLLADSPAAFATATLRLIDSVHHNDGFATQLGLQARQFVQTHYDWQQILPILTQVYENVK